MGKYSPYPGDKIPAILEDGEYVLNRNAVNAIGKEKLDVINKQEHPRFLDSNKSLKTQNHFKLGLARKMADGGYATVNAQKQRMSLINQDIEARGGVWSNDQQRAVNPSEVYQNPLYNQELKLKRSGPMSYPESVEQPADSAIGGQAEKDYFNKLDLGLTHDELNYENTDEAKEKMEYFNAMDKEPEYGSPEWQVMNQAGEYFQNIDENNPNYKKIIENSPYLQEQSDDAKQRRQGEFGDPAKVEERYKNKMEDQAFDYQMKQKQYEDTKKYYAENEWMKGKARRKKRRKGPDKPINPDTGLPFENINQYDTRMVKQLSRNEPTDSRESVVGRERIGGRQRDREERSANEKSKLSEEVLRRRSKRGLSRYEGKKKDKKDNNKAKMLKLQLKAGDLKKKAGKKVSKLRGNLAKSGLLKSFKAGYKGKNNSTTSSTKSKPDITSKSIVKKKKSEVIKAKVKNKIVKKKIVKKKAPPEMLINYGDKAKTDAEKKASFDESYMDKRARLKRMNPKKKKKKAKTSYSDMVKRGYQEGGMVSSSSVGSKINGMQMNSRRLLNMANKRRKDVRS